MLYQSKNRLPELTTKKDFDMIVGNLSKLLFEKLKTKLMKIYIIRAPKKNLKKSRI